MLATRVSELAVNRRLAIGLRVAAIAFIVVAVTLFARTLDVAKLGAAFRGARIWPLVLAALLNFACLGGKSVVWRIMLAPKYVIKVSRLWRYTTAAFAASALAPMRAGEFLRVWALKTRDGVSPADSAAVAVAEKVLDGVAMLIVCAPIPLLLPGLPTSIARAIGIGAVIAVVLFTGLYIAIGRADGTKSSWLHRFAAGMHVLRNPRRAAACVAILVAVWMMDLGEVLLVSHAVGIDISIGGGLLILFSLNVAIAIPSTPGQVGALELGAVWATSVLGVPHEPAVAFALLYHSLQIIPLIIAGLVLELPLVLGTRAMTAETKDVVS